MENGFLKEKYNLHKNPEVEKAAQRTEQQEGEKVSQDPNDRIQNHLDRLERLVLDPEKEQNKSSEPTLIVPSLPPASGNKY